MFWQTPLLLLGVLGAVCKAAPVASLDEDAPTVDNVALNTFKLDERSLDERFTVSYVFRADKRSPAELQQSGFLPKGYTSHTTIKEDVSLFRHVYGDPKTGFSLDNDGYVSTTSSQTVAEGWITKYLKGNGYTYKIATYANLIDCQDTLKGYNRYPEEKEFAALKVIPFDQVIGWAKFETKGGKVYKGAPTANPHYNSAKYANKAHAGAQYGLAGFPASHPAWNEDPWWFFTHCRPKARGVDIFARDDVSDMADIDVTDMLDVNELVPRGKLRGSRTSRKSSSSRKTRKHRTKKTKTTTKKPRTKCTVAMKKAGKCTDTIKCTPAMKKAGKCGTTCSAADKKAGKCCSLADKKAGTCGQGTCGPSKTNKQAAMEYWKQLQMGKPPRSGYKPKKAGKPGKPIVRNKKGKKMGGS